MTENTNKKKAGKIGIISGIVAAVLVVLGLLPFVVPLNQISGSYTVELGDEISTDVTDYVSGFAPGIWVSNLDVSGVNTHQAGEYKATVKQGFHIYEYSVLVEDTTAPVLHFCDENIYLEEGETYSADYFVEEVVDLSNNVDVFVSESNASKAKDSGVCIEKSGVYVLTFVARDASENEAVYTLSVTVDTAPTITGMKDYYVVPGTTLDYLEFIKASDTVDGDVTESVRVNAEGVDLSSIGSYELMYICEDSYGLSSEETVSVNVMESMDIQELINTHEIHRLNETIVGAYNLYDIGYYEDKTIDEMIEIMHPTTIRITNDTGYGSGFILEISDEEIIIGTCQHVVKNQATVDISFFEGTKVLGTVVKAFWDYDVAFVSVKREDVSQELLDRLYTVHINRGYWDSLENEADLEIGVRCITDKGTVWRDRTGKLVYKASHGDMQWRSLYEAVRVSASLFSGSSGSSIFDIHGNTLGVATYVIQGGGRYESYGMTLETLCDKFEEVFGRKLYYY